MWVKDLREHKRTTWWGGRKILLRVVWGRDLNTPKGEKGYEGEMGKRGLLGKDLAGGVINLFKDSGRWGGSSNQGDFC